MRKVMINILTDQKLKQSINIFLFKMKIEVKMQNVDFLAFYI